MSGQMVRYDQNAESNDKPYYPTPTHVNLQSVGKALLLIIY